MGDLLVDPYMLSAPPHMTEHEALGFIERWIRWIRTEQLTKCRLVIADNYLCELWLESQCPTPERWREIHRIARTQRFDAETLIRAFERILSIAPRIETVTGVTGVIIDTNRSDVVPKLVLARLSQKVKHALLDALAACALHTASTGVDYPFGFATEPLASGSTEGLTGEFCVECCESPASSTFTFPLVVVLKTPLLIDGEDVFGILDFDMVCDDAECAIQWSSVHAVPQQDRAMNPMSRFIVRDEFRQRVVNLDLPLDMLEQVYRKLTYLIHGLRPAGLEIEALRVGRGPRSAQRRRSTDGAEAFRLQVSQHGAGYHVHYWRCPDQLIEIAWIGTHEDFHIPE